MNSEKLTQKSMDAVRKAQSIAVMNSNQLILPVHLLAGLLKQENGLIPQLITKMNKDPELFEMETDKNEVDWVHGHSGVLLERQTAEHLELMWRDYIGRNKSFYLPRAVRNEDYDLRSDIDKAIELASKAHAADYDLDGNPTILHPLAVGMMGRNDAERIVGFLHDVVEDTDYDFDDIEAEGFTAEVIEALRLLTHDKQTPYEEYIERICRSGNRTAINVKMNDLRHNLARGREGNHLRYVEKHTRALAFIEGYLSQLEN